MLVIIPVWLKTVVERQPAALCYVLQVKVKTQGPVEPVLISTGLLRRIIYTKTMSLCLTKEAGTKEIPTSSNNEPRNNISSESESCENTEGEKQRKERDQGRLLTCFYRHLKSVLRTLKNVLLFCFFI